VTQDGGLFRDRRGEPTRWVALCFAVAFAVGVLFAALTGVGYRVTGILAILFLTSLRIAYGRPDFAADLIRAWRGQ
jgi:uncharacterized MAPEG superfamily protein